jgi:hypothetical protein
MISPEHNFNNSIEELYDSPLSKQESEEAARNLSGFLNLLIEINQ